MHNYFSGLYFKCQSPTQTLSVIPAMHGNSRSTQLITDSGAWNFTKYSKRNSFDAYGFSIDFHSDKVSVVGDIRFGKLSPIKYDIMGPFNTSHLWNADTTL